MRYEWGKQQRLLRDEVVIGSTEKGFWRERAIVSTGEGTWTLRAKGSRRILMSGVNGGESVVATLSGIFSPTWTVAGESATYVVKPAGAFTTRLAVIANGAQVGAIVDARWYTDRPALEIDDRFATTLPLRDAMLLLWLGYVIHSRRSRRSAAAASS